MRPYSPYWLFTGLFVISIGVWSRALSETFALALKNDAYTHLLLILPISVLLVLFVWRKQRLMARPSYLGGVVVMGLAGLLVLCGTWWPEEKALTSDIRLAIEMLAIVVWWIGAFILCFGGRVFRRCLFPMLFLLWLVPVPQFAVNRAIRALQKGTVTFTCDLFTAVGIPAAQNGARISIPGITVEVAEECSSVRSSTILVVTTMVLSYLLLRSLWGRTIVIFCALPLSIAKNGFRVFVLEGLAAQAFPEILDSPLHHRGGILFLALALGVIVGLIWIVRRLERRTGATAGGQLLPLSTSAVS